MTPLDWMRLGARAMRLAAMADCGNLIEGCMEDNMTSAGLSLSAKDLNNAQIEAATILQEDIRTTCEDSALGYASYMASEEDRKILKAEGINSKWLHRRENGKPSRMESTSLSRQEG